MSMQSQQKLNLKFWAEIDLPALEIHLKTQIFGQDAVIEKVMNSLRSYQKRAEVLEKTGESIIPGLTASGDLLPHFLFIGESGAGKTYFAKVLAQELFGAKEPSLEILDMAGKTATAIIQGVHMGYVGYEEMPPFIQCVNKFHDQGVIVFDEFTRLRSTHGMENLADRLTGFYPVFDRCFTPNNAKFANQDRYFVFPNTLLIFSGNVYDPNHTEMQVINPLGFTPIQELGRSFLARFQEPFFFRALTSHEIPQAMEFFMNKSLKTYLKRLNTVKQIQWLDTLPLRLSEIFAEKNLPPVQRKIENFIHTHLSLKQLKAELENTTSDTLHLNSKVFDFS